MNNPVPNYLVPSVLSETLLVVAAVLFGLHRALKLRRMACPRPQASV